jgi:hypothetical protein
LDNVVCSQSSKRGRLQFLAHVDDNCCFGGFPIEGLEQVAGGGIDVVEEVGGVDGASDLGREVSVGLQREVLVVVGNNAGVAVDVVVLDIEHVWWGPGSSRVRMARPCRTRRQRPTGGAPCCEGYIVTGEKRSDWQAMAEFCGAILMKASLSNDYRPTRVALGKPLDLIF